MTKYRFRTIKTVEDILRAIGREDIPSARVTLRIGSIVDEETGELLADLELEIPDEYPLSEADEKKLEALMGPMIGKKIERDN